MQNLLETYNNYKEILDEAWSAMETQDTEDDVEQDMNDGFSFKFKDDEIQNLFLDSYEEETSMRELIEDINSFINEDGLNFIETPESGSINKKDISISFYTNTNIFSFPEFSKVFYNLTSIPEMCFGGCVNLEDITLPNKITKIYECAFFGCLNLKNIILPSSLKEINEGAFAYTNLEEIIIPEGVTSIGTSAFASCYNLKSVTIPSSVKFIGKNAFGNCKKLQTVNGRDFTGVAVNAFQGTPVQKELEKDVYKGIDFSNFEPKEIIIFDGSWVYNSKNQEQEQEEIIYNHLFDEYGVNNIEELDEDQLEDWKNDEYNPENRYNNLNNLIWDEMSDILENDWQECTYFIKNLDKKLYCCNFYQEGKIDYIQNFQNNWTELIDSRASLADVTIKINKNGNLDINGTEIYTLFCDTESNFRYTPNEIIDYLEGWERNKLYDVISDNLDDFIWTIPLTPNLLKKYNIPIF